MCEKKQSGCQKGLNVNPGDCSQDQIRKCHGSEEGHRSRPDTSSD
jgi:hypothetical protein